MTDKKDEDQAAKWDQPPGFWQWVCDQDVTDDPRGDFIKDTRDVWKAGRNPSSALRRACPEAKVEFEKLWAEWNGEQED